MAIPTIEALPVAMSRERPTVFSQEGDAFFSAVEKKFQPQANAAIAGINEAAAVVDSSSVAALIAAQNAASAQLSAASIANASPWVSGSTYALNAAVISQLNQQVYRKRTNSSVSNTDPANDATNWVLANMPLMPRNLRGTNIAGSVVALDKLDSGKWIEVVPGSAAFTQTIAGVGTLGSGWYVLFRNKGNGAVTIDPTGTELIEGAQTLVLQPGWFGFIHTEGTGFSALPITQSTGYMRVTGKNTGEDVVAASPATRVLNTVEANSIVGASLSNNTITLPVGSYQFTAQAVAGGLSTVFFAGVSGMLFASPTNSRNPISPNCAGSFTVTGSPQTFTLTQSVGSVGGGTTLAGYGMSSSFCSEVNIWKVA